MLCPLHWLGHYVGSKASCLSWNDDHSTWSEARNLLGHAAKQQAGQSAATAPPNNNRIDGLAGVRCSLAVMAGIANARGAPAARPPSRPIAARQDQVTSSL